MYLASALTISTFTAYQYNQQTQLNQQSYQNKLFSQSLITEAEQGANKKDPYERSRNKIPLDSDALVIGGSSNPLLAKAIEEYLGVKLAKTKLTKFADGETHIKVLENVNGKDVYIIQPTCPPVNENVMELFLTVSAVKRAGAA